MIGRPWAPDPRRRYHVCAMKPMDLRGILRYVPQFRDKTFVIAADGAIVGDDKFGNLLMDVAVLRSLNIHTVLVHGAGAQIRALADEKVAQPSDLEGSGVTDADTLQLALTAANRLTHEVLEGLSATDQRGAATNAVIAHPLGILRGIDHLFTGRVEDGLLAEVCSHGGIGALVFANEYRQIRRARRQDVRHIQQLIQASVESEELLPRSRAAIERQLEDYFIYEVDRNPIACVA